MKGALIIYNHAPAVIVKTGDELCAEMPGSDLSDHVGLWFGTKDEKGNPEIWTVPAQYVLEAPTAKHPVYRH